TEDLRIESEVELERSRQIWQWLKTHIGIANVVLLLLILPVTGWIVVHEYLAESRQRVQQEQFNTYLEQFYHTSQSADQATRESQTTNANILALMDALKDMSGNMRSMADAIKAERKQSIQAQTRPVAIKRKPAPPCPQVIEAQKLTRIGSEVIITKTLISNPDLQTCLEGLKKKKI